MTIRDKFRDKFLSNFIVTTVIFQLHFCNKKSPKVLIFKGKSFTFGGSSFRAIDGARTLLSCLVFIEFTAFVEIVTNFVTNQII